MLILTKRMILDALKTETTFGASIHGGDKNPRTRQTGIRPHITPHEVLGSNISIQGSQDRSNLDTHWQPVYLDSGKVDEVMTAAAASDLSVKSTSSK
jgi:hypothetical protein